MSDWRTVRLGEVTENHDARRRPVKTSERIPGPYPYYGASGVIDSVDDFIYDGEYLLIAEDGENLRTRSTPIAFLARGQFWANNHAHVVQGNRHADTRFLSHLLAVTEIGGHLTGSTRPKLTQSAMDSILLRIPAKTEQVAIAEVLGAFDDKIAANVELARIVGELAETVYAAATRDAALSEKTFADLASVRGGGTPRTGVDDYWNGDVDWATPTDITALVGPYLESTARRITYSGLDACASALYPAGSILMTSRATVGAFAVTQRPTAVNQGFIVVNPHDADLNWWIYHEMRSRVDEFVSLANGATFLELSRGNFKKFRVRLADALTMKDFGAQADALHARARGALVENSVLALIRDELLPQLMSGKTRVKDAEKIVEEVL